jgi:DNA-nicking Smr family endonuclease
MAKKNKNRPPKITTEEIVEKFNFAAEAMSDLNLDLVPGAEPNTLQKNEKRATEKSQSDGELFRKYIEANSPSYETFLQKEDYSSPAPSRSDKPKPVKKNSGSKNHERYTLDLHGRKLEEAKSSVRKLFQDFIANGGKRNNTVVRVITGKGRNSGPQGAVLASAIYAFVLYEFSSHVKMLDSDPTDTAIDGGLPQRGHFDFKFLF